MSNQPTQQEATNPQPKLSPEQIKELKKREVIKEKQADHGTIIRKDV